MNTLSPTHTWPRATALFLFFLLALAPSTSWLEFSGGMENVNVATAQEIQRDHHWLIPTLNGEPRTRKPPLAEWMSAVGIRLTGTPVGARWPMLLSSCLTVVATYYLGRLIAGESVGLLAALICGSSLLFLRHAQQAQYDPPLTLLVTLGNLFLALILLERRWWVGSLGAGAAIGLACMVKGPVALLESIAPVLLFACFSRRPERAPSPPASGMRRFLAISAGTLVFLAITLPWLLYVQHVFAGRMSEWTTEVLLREEAQNERQATWWTYFYTIGWFMPWSVWLLAGVIGAFVDPPVPETRRVRLTAVLLLLPLLAMSFFPVRRDRYILPMLAPMAILAAWRLHAHFRHAGRWKPLDRLMTGAHGCLIAVPAIGLPVAGAVFLKTADGVHWYAPGTAIAAGLVALVLLIAMARRPGSLPTLTITTVLLMLMLHTLFLWGYRNTAHGRAPGRLLAERIERAFPGARIYNCHELGRDAPLELTVYLDRPLLRMPDPQQIPPSTHPELILIPGAAAAPPERPGFRSVDKACFAGSWWYVLLRDPAPAPQVPVAESAG